MIITSVVSPIQSQLYGRAFGELTKLLTGETPSVHQFIGKIRLLCGLVIAVGFARMVFTWIGIYFWMIFGEKQQKRARRHVFNVLLHKPLVWYDKKQNFSGSMATMNRCCEELRAACSEDIALLMQSFFSILFLLISAFIALWSITLVIMASAPIMAVAGWFFGGKTFIFASQENEWSAKASKVLDWSFVCGDLVRILGGKFYDLAKFNRYVDYSARAFVRMTLAVSCNSSLLRMLSFLVFVQGFWFGDSMIHAGKMNISLVFTAFSSSLMLGSQVSSIATLMAELNRGKAAAWNIEKFIADPNNSGLLPDSDVSRAHQSRDNSDITGPAPKSIRLEQVSFAYDNSTILLAISWTFSASALNYVVGRSGCGKSTLILLLMRFYPPSLGNIYIDRDICPADVSDDIFSKYACLVELSGLVFDGSLHDNLALGGSYSEELILDACNFAEMSDLVAGLSNGLYTGMSSSTLSGGQIQRIGLARAYLRDPPILILDEAMSAIDIRTTLRLQEKLRLWRQGKLTIIVTHDISYIQPADHVMHLVDGIVSEEKPDFVVEASGGYSPDSSMSAFSEKLTGSSEEQSVNSLSTDYLHSPAILKDLEKSAAADTQEFELMSVFQILRYCFGTIQRKSLITLGMILSIISGVTTPVLSFCFSKLLSGVVDTSAKRTAHNNQGAVFWSCIVIGLIVFDAIVYFVSHFCLGYSAEMWIVELRHSALAAINDQDLSFFTTVRLKPSELTTLIMNDSRDLRNLVSQFPSACISLVALTLLGVIWAIVTGWKLALVGVAFVPAIALVTIAYGWLLLIFETNYKSEVADTEKLQHNVTCGIKTVKAFGLSHHFRNVFSDQLTSLARQGRSRAISTGFGVALQQLCISVATGAVLYYGLVLVGKTQYTHSEMLQVLTLLTFALSSASTLINELPEITRGQRAGTLFSNLLALTPAEVETGGTRHVPLASPGHLVFRNVTFSYGSGDPVLSEFNASFFPGQVVGLVGKSGSGKSTVALLLARLYDVNSGCIFYDGIPIKEIEPELYRKSVLVVPQHGHVFQGTLRENLLYGNDRAKLSDSQLSEYLALCNIPLPLDTQLGEGTSSQISLGQMQRVCIARALLRKPKVLVFDECTANLDNTNKSIISDLIVSKLGHLFNNILIIVITHDPILMEALPRLLHIENGKIISQ